MRKTKFLYIIVILLLSIEALSGVVIFLMHRLKGTPKRISAFRFHPLVTGENILQYESGWSDTFPVFGYTNKINVSGECGYTTDRYGFIHNGDKDRVISEDDFTIFILGGSTVAGHGSSCNDQTIPAHLEHLLREQYPDVHVVNAGVAGYYSPLEFLKLSNEIMFYEPDVIISIGGTNDFLFKDLPYRDRDHTYFVSNYHRQTYRTLENTRSLWWSVKNLVYNLTKFTEYTYARFVIQKGIAFIAGRAGSSSKSDIVTNVKRIVGDKKLPDTAVAFDDGAFQKEMEEKIAYFKMYLEETNALTTAMGKRYYFVLQPVLFTGTRVLSKEEREAAEIFRHAYFKKHNIDIQERAEYFWRRVDEELDKERQIVYYDLTDIFHNESGVYSDHLHYTDYGNLKIAQALYKMLVNAGSVPEQLIK